MGNQKLMKQLEEGRYEDGIRMIPESMSYVGYEESMMVLLKYLLLCLGLEKKSRPDPCWSIVILKNVYGWV